MIRTLVKDLLYNSDNSNLDISRLCSFMIVIAYLGWSGMWAWQGHFKPVEFGGGWTAIAAGSAGWIYARQKMESDGKAS